MITDKTRRCPDHIIVPTLVQELKKAGVRREDIMVVTALGIHRPMTAKEIRAKMGEVYGRVKVINHNCHDKKHLIYIDTTRRLKTPVSVNQVVAEADIVLTTGVVEAHSFAGYSGGRKSIMPSVSGEEAIASTHNPELIDNSLASVGNIKSNYLHEDMVEMARLAGVSFIVNVVLNSKNEIVRAAAGDLVAAHEELTATYDKMYKVKIDEVPDIVISAPTPPKDINLYQATRAGNNFVLVPKPLVKREGIIIVPALCKDGIGDQLFYEWMKSAESSSEVIERAKRDHHLGMHKPYILSKILEWAEVVITNSLLPGRVIRKMHMTPSDDLEVALRTALEKLGSDARILISTHGISTIPTLSG